MNFKKVEELEEKIRNKNKEVRELEKDRDKKVKDIILESKIVKIDVENGKILKGSFKELIGEDKYDPVDGNYLRVKGFISFCDINIKRDYMTEDYFIEIIEDVLTELSGEVLESSEELKKIRKIVLTIKKEKGKVK